MPKHRCNRKGCQVWLSPHYLHPLLVDGRRSSTLQQQAATLYLLLQRLPHTAIHHILDCNHKVVQDMAKRLRDLRKSWVEERDTKIVFGTGTVWKDVEADEATFDKKDLGRDANPVEWEALASPQAQVA